MSSIKEEHDDHFFMKEALKEAKKAFQKDEVPIGAVLVFENKIISRGHNQVEMLKDATAHAEMLCMTSGASYLGNWRLLNTTLYCTIEPCTMCAGGMLLSRIKKLVWGANDSRHGSCGSWINLFEKKHPTHQIEIVSHVLHEECAWLIQDFFKKKRLKNVES